MLIRVRTGKAVIGVTPNGTLGLYQQLFERRDHGTRTDRTLHTPYGVQLLELGLLRVRPTQSSHKRNEHGIDAD